MQIHTDLKMSDLEIRFTTSKVHGYHLNAIGVKYASII